MRILFFLCFVSVIFIFSREGVTGILPSLNDSPPLGSDLAVDNISFTYRGHRFNADERCYRVQLDWDVLAAKFHRYKKPHLTWEPINHYTDNGEICWDPFKHKLTVDFKRLGFKEYTCNKDPILGDGVPSCRLVSWGESGGRKYYTDKFVWDFISKKGCQELRKSIPFKTIVAMKLEAIANSMSVEVSKKVTMAPGDVTVILKTVAVDFTPPHKGWPVLFYLEKKGVGTMKNKVTKILKGRGGASCSFKGLTPGTYWAKVKIFKSLTSSHVVNSSPFKVKSKSKYRPEWNLASPKNDAVFSDRDSIPISVCLPSAESLKNARLVFRWGWAEEKPFYPVPFRPDLLFEETVHVNPSTRFYMGKISASKLDRIMRQKYGNPHSLGLYYLDLFLRGSELKWNYTKRVSFRITPTLTDNKMRKIFVNPNHVGILKVISPKGNENR